MEIHGSRGLQIGDHNAQTNLDFNAATVPPAQRVAAEGAPVHNLPPASGVFVGRDLAQLARLLPGDDGGVVVGQAAVHGLGGIGKTELALHYARAYLARYGLVWWVTADSAENVGLGLAALTRRLHPVATLADAQAWAVGWLQSNRGWLLVLDNVEDFTDVSDLLGQVLGQGHVLVTTRRDLGRARWSRLRLTPLRLDVLSRAASVELLTELTGLPDTAAADRLAADLGDLPLALEQAGAYLSQHPGLDFDAYRDLLTTRFDRVAANAGEGGPAQRTVASVWLVTMNAVRTRSPLADRVMGALGWMAPEALPEDVLLPLADGDPVELGDALALLASYNMIARDDGRVGVHRLVQAVIRAAAPPEALDAVISLLHAALPEKPILGVSGWPRWNELLPHLDAVLASLPSTHANVDALSAGRQAALYRQFQGQTAEAVAAFEHLLAEHRRVFGAEHRQTLRARSNLASAYHSADRLAEAVAAEEQLLADSCRLLGDDDSSTLYTRYRVGFCYLIAGRFAEAITVREQLVTDHRRLSGDEDLKTLQARAELADAYRAAGRIADAVSGYEEVVGDFQRVLGPDCADTLYARSNLAFTYMTASRFDEAIVEQARLITDCVRLLGADHYDTLLNRRWMASFHERAGRTAEAIAGYESLLPDFRRMLGDDHPDTQKLRRDLARCLKVD